jgi:hypothetical protein
MAMHVNTLIADTGSMPQHFTKSVSDILSIRKPVETCCLLINFSSLFGMKTCWYCT